MCKTILWLKAGSLLRRAFGADYLPLDLYVLWIVVVWWVFRIGALESDLIAVERKELYQQSGRGKDSNEVSRLDVGGEVNQSQVAVSNISADQ